jgi:hypothetical protein
MVSMPVNQDEGRESAWRTLKSVDRIPGNGKDGPVLQPNIHNCSTLSISSGAGNWDGATNTSSILI